jgi:hypothetical protein
MDILILILQEDGRPFLVKDDLGLISREHTLYFKPTIDQMDQQKARKIWKN